MRPSASPRIAVTAVAPKIVAVGLAVLAGAIPLSGARAQSPAPPQPPAASGQQAPQPLTYVITLGPDALRSVQDRLHAVGAYSGAVDGSWGPDSQAALERFQQTSGLQVTGQLNQATVATLGLTPSTLVGAATALPAPAAPPAPPPAAAAAAPPAAPGGADHPIFQLSDDSVRLVQSRLRANGFYYGPIDGVWGGGTQAAMHGFQAARGLPVTERLNGPTVTALGIDPTNMTPAQ